VVELDSNDVSSMDAPYPLPRSNVVLSQYELGVGDPYAAFTFSPAMTS
jgi:hypothetical protein